MFKAIIQTNHETKLCENRWKYMIQNLYNDINEFDEHKDGLIAELEGYGIIF